MRPLKGRTGRGATVEARIRDAIESLRPLLHLDACGIELVEFESTTGTASLRIEGDCPDCDMSAATMIHGIEAHLRLRVPEIRSVRAVQGGAANG